MRPGALLAQYHRRGAIEQRALRRLAAEPPALSDEDLERLHELAALGHLGGEIDAALGRLPATLRDAVSLRVIDELPYADIANRLSITPGRSRARQLSAVHAASCHAERPESAMRNHPQNSTS